jgi:hypothetical protein
MPLYNYHEEFFTATILRWQHLLTADTYKQIIIDSLQWLSRDDRCYLWVCDHAQSYSIALAHQQ